MELKGKVEVFKKRKQNGNEMKVEEFKKRKQIGFKREGKGI